MNLLSKLIPLQKRCAAYQLRSEAQIRQHDRRLTEIAQQLEGIAEEIQEIKQLIQTNKPKNDVLNRASFFSFLRKQAKLRHQIQKLDIQRTTLLEQQEKTEEEKSTARTERIFWLRKQDKYQHWATQYKRGIRLARLLREENDIEEVTKWTT